LIATGSEDDRDAADKRNDIDNNDDDGHADHATTATRKMALTPSPR
jgi:hypothetical protein